MARVRIAVFVTVACGVSLPHSVLAGINYSSIGSTYTQNFNGLAATDTGIAWTNDDTIDGWHLFRITSGTPYNSTPVPVTSYDASSGTSDGRFFSYGAVNDGERALGSAGFGNFAGVINVPFGNVLGWAAASFTNDTASTLTQFTVNYDGELWRDGGNEVPETMVFEYGFGASFSTVASWTAPGGAFDWTAPIPTTTSPSGEVDGNSDGLVEDRGGTISNFTWAAGETLWLRWVEHNNAGADFGLAIDNFTFMANVSAVPEPGAVLFGGLVCSVIGLAVSGRRLIAKFKGRLAE